MQTGYAWLPLQRKKMQQESGNWCYLAGSAHSCHEYQNVFNRTGRTKYKIRLPKRNASRLLKGRGHGCDGYAKRRTATSVVAGSAGIGCDRPSA